MITLLLAALAATVAVSSTAQAATPPKIYAFLVNDEMEVMIDRSALQVSGSVRSAAFHAYLASPLQDKTQILLTTEEYNCTQHTHRLVEFRAFTGKGALVDETRGRVDAPWHPNTEVDYTDQYESAICNPPNPQLAMPAMDHVVRLNEYVDFLREKHRR